jgi:cytochrome bd-type quinol oxidase subunit 2
MPDVLFVLMRWLHFASMATLVGGIIYGRLVMTSSIAALSPDTRDAFDGRAARGYRPLVLGSVIGLIVSGTYNLLTNPGHTPKYHMLLGIKLMLALHVFAVAFLVTQPKNPRRARMLTGTMISGLIILAISAYLRRIF